MKTKAMKTRKDKLTKNKKKAQCKNNLQQNRRYREFHDLLWDHRNKSGPHIRLFTYLFKLGVDGA